jgi:DNA transposition AAA+ family ATPase
MLLRQNELGRRRPSGRRSGGTEALKALENGAIAPLRNVGLFGELVDKVQRRAQDLPGLACFYGHSGYGKTRSAVLAANRSRAWYVEMGETWARSSLCDAILHELSERSSGPIARKMQVIIDRMGEMPERPLIIDEADFIIRRGMVDMIREIHDKSQAPIILIGEEMLPAKLQKFERAHNRVLDWVAAQPCNLDDTRMLAALYAPGVACADDLLEALLSASGGRIRRICVNIERVHARAAATGAVFMSLESWGKEPFFTGEPPRRRRT